MDVSIKAKTNGLGLGDGYIRGWMRDLQKKNYANYVAYMDLFASSAVDFAQYGLSKEELTQWTDQFKADPWVPL